MRWTRWLGRSPLFINQSLDFIALRCDSPALLLPLWQNDTQPKHKQRERERDGRAGMSPPLSPLPQTLDGLWERERDGKRERGSHWPQHSPPADDEVTRYGWPSEQVVMCGLKQDMNRVYSLYVCSHRVQCGLCSFGDVKIEYSQLL